MAQQLQGLGAPINYYDMIPDFRREALMETQNRVGQQAVISSQMDNQQRQQEQQDRVQYYDAMRNAKPEDLPALRRQFPKFAQDIQQEIGIQGAEHAAFANKAMGNLSVAMQSGDPNQITRAVQAGEPVWNSMQTTGRDIMQLIQSDPERAKGMLTSAYMATLPFDEQAKISQNQQKIDETIRSNQAGEQLTARGQGMAAQNARLAANSATGNMKDYAEYSRLLKTDPNAAAVFAQVAGIKTGGDENRMVQLSDGRTVTVKGKLHGAGQNAFYEAVDNAGNIIRVPPSAIAATASSAASAQNYAMKKDIDLISSAEPGSLDFLTGVTGGTGKPALGADIRSKISGKGQRQIYNAAQRIQGKMQNQGIAAARDMGASGINTVAEAKMYFQGMPQFDYSSPEAAKQSAADIKDYTDNYNQQYNVNVGKPSQSAIVQQAQSPAQGGYSSLWGD
ncbi:TPA: phage DNA ejection protein [Yersinia enterocolitica]|uniref:DNA transfer protein n=1 Tax=Yersinia enterocolitica TaxID=630 RepID=UPI003304F475|nr:phage DNA ejection protein [Yersinia enterocolitica]HDL6982543.1 phage DNA ejection protein [Yersinia enterocolitica]HDL7066362.1 phage DNA ejection protein [Yersinia enterocolitica]HDL7070747.1 phage DNA ejection protein [Yersinia enterocolitica]HDL7100119.1 phage DNA ejection protein [Yersinia enterocolitica]